MRDAHRNWLSVHVFLSDPVRTERYLSEVLDPAIKRWRAEEVLDRWFFIRYWEGGPHLRIRLAGRIAANDDRVMETLSERIAHFCSDNPSTREEYYRGHSFDGRPVVVENLPWYAEGTIAEIDYQPEILRYGGEYGIDANEQLFDLSSRLALSLCKATEGNRNDRLSSTFALMTSAILACGEDMPGLGTYFEQYGSMWASMVGPEVLEAAPPQPSEGQLRLLLRLEQEARAGWDGTSAHAIWAAGVRQLAERLRALHGQGQLIAPFGGRTTVGDDMCKGAVLGIVGSQIHMLNNRLGILPAGEFLLARVLAGAANALKQQDRDTMA